MGTPRYVLDRFPSWVRTIDAMIAEGAYIQADCRTCGMYRQVDLEKIRQAKGGSYCLINRRTKCPEPGCTGKIRFSFKLGVMRGLWTVDVSDLWMARDIEERQNRQINNPKT